MTVDRRPAIAGCRRHGDRSSQHTDRSTAGLMAKDQNTFAKMQREMEKKRKAEDKRERRRKRKEEAQCAASPAPVASPDEEV